MKSAQAANLTWIAIITYRTDYAVAVYYTVSS